MRTILLKSNNVLAGSNNSKYEYTFPSGGAVFKDNMVALSSLSIYYSWFNISSTNGNNSYSYKWINGTIINITMPDGFYTLQNLNEYLQREMVANKHYLINADGEYVYYLEWQENATQYAVQLNCYSTPTSLPSNWTKPGISWSLGSGFCPQVTVFNNGFSNVVGFYPGSYPSTTTSIINNSFISQFTPQISPTSSILILCSIINNDLGNNQVLYSFSPNVSFGSQINVSPPQHIWNEILDGKYDKIKISFVDQDYNQLPINDNNLVLILSVIENQK